MLEDKPPVVPGCRQRAPPPQPAPRRYPCVTTFILPTGKSSSARAQGRVEQHSLRELDQAAVRRRGREGSVCERSRSPECRPLSLSNAQALSSEHLERGMAEAASGDQPEAPGSQDAQASLGTLAAQKADGGAKVGGQRSAAALQEPSQASGDAAAEPAAWTVLVQIRFDGKAKVVKHKASTKIGDLLALYRKRFGAVTGRDLAGMKVSDDKGVEQDGDVTLSELQPSSTAKPSTADPSQAQVCLNFEDDDWFD